MNTNAAAPMPRPRRVLLIATTTGYQTRQFEEAAARLGVDIVYATDRCDHLDDPWRDGAIPVRFHDEEASAATIVAALSERPVDGVLAVGDRPAVLAAALQRRLGLPGIPPRRPRSPGTSAGCAPHCATQGFPFPTSRS